MNNTMSYFRSFCTVSKAFGTTLGKDDLLELIVSSAIETMSAKAASLFLYDEKKDLFVPAFGKGLSERYLHAAPMQARKVVDGILQGGCLIIKDAVNDPRVENREIKKAEGIGSILVVPVTVLNKPIGVLTVYTQDQRDFGKDEIDFLTALAEQGGVAIRTANLIERIKRNSELFYEISTDLTSSLEIKNILHAMNSNLSKSFGLTGSIIYLLSKDTEALQPVASFGLPDFFSKKGSIKNEPAVMRCLNGEVVQLQTQTRTLFKSETEAIGVTNMLLVPITAAESVIGLIKLCSSEPDTFSEDTVQLAMAVAKQGGLAIQNASNYLKLLEDKKCLEEDIWCHKSWF